MKLSSCVLIAASFLPLAGAAQARDGSRPQPAPSSPATAEYEAPAAKSQPSQVVRASWYGGGERLNQRTSTGEIFRPMGQTAAHRSLPLGTVLRVSSLATGRSTVVRVNDRGPAASTGRSLDLSKGAALALGLVGTNDTRVALQILH